MDAEALHSGQVGLLIAKLDELLDLLTTGRDWGGAGDLERLFWDPAAPAGGAPLSAEYAYDGVFASIAIFNLSAGSVRVALTSSQSVRDRSSLFTLSARGFIVLPYRGTTVSVSGDVAGSALVVAFEVPQPVNAGTF